MKKTIIFFHSIFLIVWGLAQAPYTHPATDDEFIGPFPSWIDVKTHGAIGDGVSDETTALQSAFDAIGNDNSTASVVYIPVGIYRITGTLKMNFKINVSIIGADPTTTIIKWAGAKDGTMLQINGTAYSRFNRITWDGSSTAFAAIDQSWDAIQPHFDSGNEYADNVFTNVGIGIRGGHLGHGFAETAIMRCKFIRNSIAGISLGNFNALDVWIWNSVFQDCAIGVTNVYGAGNFKVYNSIFRNSTESDIKIGNTGEFSFRDNTSINSQAFITTLFTGNPALMTIQGNTIIDPISNTAIDIRNQGPVTFLDNIIRSRAYAIPPIVTHSSYPNSDFYSMGNTFTVENALQVDRSITFDDKVVLRNNLNNLSEPVLPDVQPDLHREVFGVAPGSKAGSIQNVINQAALAIGNRPVVHIPHGTYYLNSTLTIPAGSDVQIVGDGDGDVHPTILQWSGNTAGPVIKIIGPSKATFRDFSINGGGIATNILVTNVDQIGSRVFMHQMQARGNENNLLVNGLDHTLTLAYNSGFSNSLGKSVNIIGGVLAAVGMPREARTVIFAGAESNNSLSHEVTNGANLLIRDVWYESGQNGPYLNLSSSGHFVVEGSRIASPQNTSIPQMRISNFSGKATFLSSTISDRIAITGNGSQTKVLGLSNLSIRNVYIADSTLPQGDIRSFNTRARDPNSSRSHPVKNIGKISKAFLISMLEAVRNVHAQVLTPLPNGITDIRFYRIWTSNGIKGVEIKGSDIPLPVQFLLFNTRCTNDGSVTLTWKTAQEINSQRFDIERSDNGSNWKVIGSINAAGNSNDERSYSYTDNNLGGSNRFYRIVEYDIDGKTTISTVSKSYCTVTNDFSVHPNPANKFIIVEVQAEESTPLKLLFYDAKGSLIKSTQATLGKGNNLIEVDINDLTSGFYNLKAIWENNIRVSKLIKN